MKSLGQRPTEEDLLSAVREVNLVTIKQDTPVVQTILTRTAASTKAKRIKGGSQTNIV